MAEIAKYILVTMMLTICGYILQIATISMIKPKYDRFRNYILIVKVPVYTFIFITITGMLHMLLA